MIQKKLMEVENSTVIHRVSSIRSKLILLLCIIPGFLTLRGAELPDPGDFSGMVNFWERFFTETRDRYLLIPVDTFEKDRLYFSRANSSDHVDVRFLFKKPEHPGFIKEMNMIHTFGSSGAESERSLFINTSFNIPGQIFMLNADRPIHLKGRPVRASIWINSNKTRNSLSLIFYSSSGKEIEVPVKTLFWKGWKRIDIALPETLYNDKYHTEKSRLSFKGFVIRSPSGSETESVSILMDNFLVLSDISGLQYSGSEYADEW